MVVLNMKNTLPLLYSFRRCPYAIRARIALYVTNTEFTLREVDLKHKPDDMLALSPKGTVPVFVLTDGHVIDESLAVVDYLLDYQKDILTEDLIKLLHDDFIPALNRFKYHDRYDDVDLEYEKNILLTYLKRLDAILDGTQFLCDDKITKADIAILPFVRQLAVAGPDWFDSISLNHVSRWYGEFINSELCAKVMAH